LGFGALLAIAFTILTVQKKGVLKSMNNSKEGQTKQTNAVCLNDEEKYFDTSKVLAKERVVMMSADFNLYTMGDIYGVILSTNGHTATVLLIDGDDEGSSCVGLIDRLCKFDNKICWKRGQVIEISTIGAIKDFVMPEEDIESLCNGYDEQKADDVKAYRDFLGGSPNRSLYEREKKSDEGLKEARKWYVDTKLSKNKNPNVKS